MPFGLIVVISWMAFVALFGLALLGWALHDGQFDDDLEDTKYVVFREQDPAPWPGREKSPEEV